MSQHLEVLSAKFNTQVILAIMLPFATCAIQLIFWDYIKPLAWVLFFPTIFIAPMIGGLRGGIGATLISTALVWSIFLAHPYESKVEHANTVISIVVFIMTGVVFSVIIERYNEAKIALAIRKAVIRSDYFLQEVLDNMTSMAAYWDVDGSCKYSNSHYKSLLRVMTEDTSIPTLSDIISPDLYNHVIPYIPLTLCGQRQESEIGLATCSGNVCRMKLQYIPYRCTEGIITGYFMIIEDITSAFEAARALKEVSKKNLLAASVFTYAREGILITLPDATIIDVNDAFTRITGYTRNEVLGKNPAILKSCRHTKDFYAEMWETLIEKKHWYGEIWNRRRNGEVYAEMLNITTVCDDSGRPINYVGIFTDITALKDHQGQLEHIAHYDALTNLPNRVLLADRIHQGMVQAHRNKKLLALAFLDLDGFKAINDKHGHEVGDKLLTSVAVNLKQALREGDTLSRLGGDEFVAVILDLPSFQSSESTLLRMLAAAAEPVLIDGVMQHISASIGVSFYPQNEIIDADQLLRQADQAMYQAKLAGKNCYHIFDIELDRSIRGQHETLADIKHGMDEGEFVLYYQPKVNMRSGAVIGAEALIRWKHPKKGLLSPLTFLPVIEGNILNIKLGEWVLDTALADMEMWHGAGLDIPVSVNISGHHLQQANFIDRLCTILATHTNIMPGDLDLEVLETNALEDLNRVSQVIKSCAKIGVFFALDDFGTGYSSLTYLKRLPVTLLKIDQSFVRGVLDDRDDLAILESVIALASAFNRQVIAEGVETPEHGERLLQLGCELAQGFGIARPMLGSELPGWSSAWRPDTAWIDLAPLSHDDLPMLYASVEHRAWIVAIERYLKGASDAPPQLEHHQCRFGIWLDNCQSHRVAEPYLTEIVYQHVQLHDLAVNLCKLKGGDLKSEATSKLDELYCIRDKLDILVRDMLRRASNSAIAHTPPIHN